MAFLSFLPCQLFVASVALCSVDFGTTVFGCYLLFVAFLRARRGISGSFAPLRETVCL